MRSNQDDHRISNPVGFDWNVIIHGPASAYLNQLSDPDIIFWESVCVCNEVCYNADT